MKAIKIILKILFVFAILAFVYYMSSLVLEDEAVKALVAEYGYIGLFFLSLLSGFNLLVPIPAIIFLPIFLSAGLNFWISLTIIVVGMTIGDIVGFALGRLGKDLFLDKVRPQWFLKIEKFVLNHPKLIPLFLFIYVAFIPLPNEIVVLPLAFFGIRFRYLIIPILLGNLFFNTISGITYVSIFNLF